MYMLSTIDNPFDPFTQFDEWFAFDAQLGHHSASLLARVVKTSDELSEPDQDVAIEQGIDTIIEEDPLGIYIKVKAKPNPVQIA